MCPTQAGAPAAKAASAHLPPIPVCHGREEELRGFGSCCCQSACPDFIYFGPNMRHCITLILFFLQWHFRLGETVSLAAFICRF